jgi:hypothetical protein
MVEGCPSLFACCMAARSVQLPVPSLQTKSPRFESAPSPVELTVKVVAACAPGWRRLKRPAGWAARIINPVRKSKESIRGAPEGPGMMRGIRDLLAKQRRQ